MNTRHFLKAVACAAAVVALGPVHAEAAYPNKPIKLVVPFAPGGSTDLAARLVAEFGSRELGQQIVVENKPGAGGSMGMEFVARSPADGYTLGMATVSTHGANPAVYGSKLKYDPIKDFAPVTNVATTPSVFAVNPAKVQAMTMKDFIAAAKAAPGKFSYGSPGTGSLGHANISHFTALAQIELLHVPYKGAGQAMNDAVAGQVDAITDNLPSALPHIKAGKLRALAVLSEKRSPALPDVPTTKEAGLPEFQVSAWNAIFAPKGTSPEVVKRLNDALQKALKDEGTRKRLLDLGADLTNTAATTPDGLAKFVQGEVARWRDVLAKAGVKAQEAK
ncbi:MAG TPA: tripartite tricarboxylate transporter substrate binding protein [Ramlibacter sp.]|nr:tripartite tricarboxylate transporter substrate binding protein [Ramlibacter sp.]